MRPSHQLLPLYTSPAPPPEVDAPDVSLADHRPQLSHMCAQLPPRPDPLHVRYDRLLLTQLWQSSPSSPALAGAITGRVGWCGGEEERRWVNSVYIQTLVL
jgi:hypothetical protein